MHRVFCVLSMLAMFSMTACGDENSPEFYASDTNIMSEKVSANEFLVTENEPEKDEGFFRTREEKVSAGLQNLPEGTIFMIKGFIPVMEIRVDELLNGEIQITEVLN